MLKKQQLKIIDSLSGNDLEQFEKNVFHFYIEKNSIDISNSKDLIEYFADFVQNKDYQKLIDSFSINDFEDLQNFVELLIPKQDRKLNGAFFTPTYIVDFIINEINPTSNEKNLDPSCGCGAFLVGLLKFYQKKYNKSIKETINNNIYGIDILDYNIKRTKLLLILYGLHNNEIIEENDFNLLGADSLRELPTKLFKKLEQSSFDTIISNPPYVKFQDLSNNNREYLFKDWETLKYGTFNLYFAFFELGYKLLSPTGRLGYITPNNYFTSLSGEILRRYFQRKQCITKIIDFNHRKVFNSLTYTAITFIDKEVNSCLKYDRIKDSQKNETFLKEISFSSVSCDELNPKKWRLLKQEDKNNIKNIESIGTPIGKLFDIRVGIATLKDDLFFIDGTFSDDKYYYKQSKTNRYKIEKGITKAIYKISDFSSQEDILSNKRRIIFPYIINKGFAEIIDEQMLKKTYPHCYKYFGSVKEELERRDKGKSIISPFYAYGRTQGLTRVGTKILTPTFSKYPKFLVVQDKDALYCNGYGIYYKENDINMEMFPSRLLQDESNIYVLQKILNSIVMHYYISKTSVSIAGGYPCYQKNFIEKFCIPDLTQKELDLIVKMQNPDKINEFLKSKYRLTI